MALTYANFYVRLNYLNTIFSILHICIAQQSVHAALPKCRRFIRF